MKASLKSRTRLSPDAAVRIAAEAAPSLPPVRLVNGDKSQSFNTRLRAAPTRAAGSSNCPSVQCARSAQIRTDHAALRQTAASWYAAAC
jgi:hypothetical protein